MLKKIFDILNYCWSEIRCLQNMIIKENDYFSSFLTTETRTN